MMSLLRIIRFFLVVGVLTPGALAGEVAGPKQGSLVLRCPAVTADHTLPAEFTGDGEGVSPPLAWSGAPAGVRGFAVVMHHIDPEGVVKWYWTLYNIPPEVRALPKNAQGIGVLGNNSVSRRVGYAPPNSKGPGAKTYVITLYALAAELHLTVPPAQVNREVLLSAMKDITLEQSELTVTYSRPGEPGRRDRDAGKGRSSEKK